jgi:hypothetical protein
MRSNRVKNLPYPSLAKRGKPTEKKSPFGKRGKEGDLGVATCA